MSSLKKRDDLIERIDHERIRLAFKNIKHRCKAEGVDWLMEMEHEIETDMETLVSVPGATTAKEVAPTK